MLKWIHADVALMPLLKGDLIALVARMKPEHREGCTLSWKSTASVCSEVVLDSKRRNQADETRRAMSIIRRERS